MTPSFPQENFPQDYCPGSRGWSLPTTGKMETRCVRTNRNCSYLSHDHISAYPLTLPGGSALSLDIFFAHRHQCAFDVHIERFRASMSLPPAQQPHPALLDAMYLMACYFSQMPATQEGYYLQRALTGISSSLQDSDRLIQIVQASCLIAIYFFSRGRTLEGYYHSSTAARLAVSLGLHQIKSEEWYRLQFDAASSIAQPAFLTFKSSLQLPTPKDSIEYTERVAAFWQVFQVDRAWSVASGLPAALPDDDNSPRARVETTWPAAIGDTQVRSEVRSQCYI